MSVPALLLTHSSTSSTAAASALRAAGGRHWLFLDPSYARLLAWEVALEGVERVAGGPTLERASAELRRPYLDLIAELGCRHDSIEWWTSRIAERNTAFSHLFLRCCYLQLARKALSTPGPLLVVAEGTEVLEAVAAMATDRRVGWVAPPPRLRVLTRWSERTLRVARWLRGAHVERRAARRVPLPRPGFAVLLRTWADDECFGADGHFSDRYLPGLYDWLTARGERAITMPVLWNLRRSCRDACDFLAAQPREYLVPARLLRLSDHLFALRIAVRQLRLPRGRVELAGMDVTRLFAAERERQAFEGGCLNALLASRLPRRLAQAGLKPRLLVDIYEGMILERGTALGMRESFPGVSVVGYQHAALYPLLLSAFATREDAKRAPLPQRIVTSGRIAADALVAEGLPRARVAVGPALRYATLRERRAVTQRPDRPTAVVPLPLMAEWAVELLVKVRLALGGEDIDVIVADHPMAKDLDAVWHEAGLDPPPTNLRLAKGRFTAQLEAASVVVGVTSTALLEAVAAGKPVVVVGHEGSLSLNPLAWFGDLGQPLYAPEEIRIRALEFATLDREKLAAYRERTAQILTQAFEPVADEAMAVFISDLLHAG